MDEGIKPWAVALILILPFVVLIAQQRGQSIKSFVPLGFERLKTGLQAADLAFSIQQFSDDERNVILNSFNCISINNLTHFCRLTSSFSSL